jgi:hypothetical protein
MFSFYLLALGSLALAEPRLQTAFNQWGTHASITTAGLFGEPEWNGFVTFAHAVPLRCLGEDANEKFDVAILGRWRVIRSYITTCRDALVTKKNCRCTL